MTVEQLAAAVLDACEAAGVEHMLTGAFATSLYGVPRSTSDVDVVVDAAAGAGNSAGHGAAGPGATESAPILPLSGADPSLPVVCCVNLESGGAALRENAARFFGRLVEGRDLIYFV